MLQNKIPDVMGKMAPFLTSKDAGNLTKKLQRRTTTTEIIKTASTTPKTEDVNNK